MIRLRRAVSLAVGAVVLIGSIGPIQPALAFDTSSDNYINGQYYNSLVSDGDFVDVNSMSVGAIQAFLSGKGGYLANAPSSQLGDRAGGRNAAQIIYDAAHGAGEASGSLNGISINSATGERYW